MSSSRSHSAPSTTPYSPDGRTHDENEHPPHRRAGRTGRSSRHGCHRGRPRRTGAGRRSVQRDGCGVPEQHAARQPRHVIGADGRRRQTCPRTSACTSCTARFLPTRARHRPCATRRPMRWHTCPPRLLPAPPSPSRSRSTVSSTAPTRTRRPVPRSASRWTAASPRATRARPPVACTCWAPVATAPTPRTSASGRRSSRP